MKENRKPALAVLIAAIAVSVFGLGGIKLNGARGSVMAVYETGSLHDGLSVKTDLNRRGTEGEKLAAIGAVYLGEDDEDVKALSDAAREINETAEIGERLELSRNIGSAQAKVYARLANAGMSDTDARDARLLDRNITDAGQTIANDVYFENASAFNKTLRGFPANVIAGLFGIEQMAENR